MHSSKIGTRWEWEATNLPEIQTSSVFRRLLYVILVSYMYFSAIQPYLVSLLGPLPDQNHSLNSLLLSLEAQARVLLDKIGKASANGSVPKSGKSNEKVAEKTSDDKLAR